MSEFQILDLQNYLKHIFILAHFIYALTELLERLRRQTIILTKVFKAEVD